MALKSHKQCDVYTAVQPKLVNPSFIHFAMILVSNLFSTMDFLIDQREYFSRVFLFKYNKDFFAVIMSLSPFHMLIYALIKYVLCDTHCTIL